MKLPIATNPMKTSWIVALACFGILCPAAEAKAARPSIVFIVADDLGYGELGSYDDAEIPTPHLDRLAREGLRFTHAYVTAPYCAASRAALLTGRYQTRFGFEFNPVGTANLDPAIGLPTTERTLADHLREEGYATALIGKWHLGGTARFHPQRRGFDEFFGFLHEGHYFVPPPWHRHTTWLRRRGAAVFPHAVLAHGRPRGLARRPLEVVADPGETRDLSGTESARRQALLATFERMDAEMVEPLWGPAGRR
jgi:hypothetical protein